MWTRRIVQRVEVRCPLLVDALREPQNVVSRRSTITNRKCQMQAYLNLKLRSMNDKCRRNERLQSEKKRARVAAAALEKTPG